MVVSRIDELDSLLSKALGEDVRVLAQKCTALTAPGEHYGSVMLALQVTLDRPQNRQNILNLVAKLLPANAMLRVAFDVGVTFKKEVLAYNDAIPALVRLQRRYNVPEDKLHHHLFPKCYGARWSLNPTKETVDDDGVLIFENLKLQGYATEDRLVGFDYDACRIILRDLARFHAVPIALKLLEPEVFETKIQPCLVHNNGLEQLPEEIGKSFHNAIMEGALEVPELEGYIDRIQAIMDDAILHPYVNRPPPNEPWGTMAHSDFWVSNTMTLKDATGHTVKNKIVDLQIMRYASAVRDLVFFLFTSVVNKVLDENFEEFLRIYHDTFVETLKEFDLDLEEFSWEQFRKELDEVAPTEVYHVLVMLKPICTERGKVQNGSEDFQDSDWSRKDLLGPNHRRKLRDTVLSLGRCKWL